MNRGARSVVHILSGDLWAGAEVQAFHLAVALADRSVFKPRVLLLNDRLLASRLRERGIPVEVVPEEGSDLIRLSRRSAHLIRRWDPAIVHSHGYKENILAVLAAPAHRGRRLVRTQHGSPFPGGSLSLRTYYQVDRFFARRFFGRTISVSGGIAGELRRFLPEEKITIVRNGIPLPPEREEGAADLPFGGEELIVLSVGRLAREKRFDRLIDAVAMVAEEIDRVRLVIVGDGPERGPLEERGIRALPGKICFTGFLDETGSIFRKAAVYVVSSDREGLPMSLLEAMARGLPVLSTPVGGIPELAAGGDRLLLSADMTARGLARPLRELLLDRTKRAIIGRAGKELVEREHSIDRVAADTEAVYTGMEAGR